MQTFIKNKKLKSFLILLLLFSGSRAMAQFGGTFTFDGTSQSVTTPVNMMNGLTVFTIEYWIKTTENRSSGTYWQRPNMVAATSNGAPSGDFGITTDNGYIGMWSGLNNGGDNFFLSATKQINDNAWHHIAAVNNGTIVTLYVDGVSQGTITSGLGFNTTGAGIGIGAASLSFSFSGNVGNSNFFHQGIYDEVRFSNSARYASNFTVPAAAFTTDANTVALYHLDGCTGGLVPDASANANSGQPHNFTGSCAFTLPATPAIPATAAVTNINKAEYFYDVDPGFGNGINIPVTASMDINNLAPALNTSALANGAHRVYIRTRDASMNWSLTNVATFVIVAPTPTIPASALVTRVLKAEYFYDMDPGFGNGVNIPVTPNFDVTGSFAVNTASLGSGSHRIYLRTQDSLKHWSLTNVASFYILSAPITIPANNTPGNIVKAEYFIDTDPGFGAGNNIPVTAGTDITLSNVFVNITGIPDGVHRIFVRTKDAAGTWSLTNLNTFSIVAASVTIPSNPVPGNITKFEYFFDTDPGFGNGHTISVTPTTDLSNYTFAADVSALNDSMHTLYVRTYDGWSMTTTKSFIKGSVTPVTWLSFNAKMKADSVLLNWSTASELNNARYEIQRSADGNSFTTIGTMNGNGTSSLQHDYAFTDKQPLNGVSYYRIKQVDLDGRFTYSVVIAIRFGGGSSYTAVYPNPAKDLLHLQFGGKEKTVTVNIFDAAGKLIESQRKENQPVIDINISKLASGIYYLEASDGKVSGKTKFIKE